MPSWKKVITSGSDASLNSLNVINGITGSLLGTASFATSASYVNPLNQLVIITGSLIQGLAGNIATGEYSHAEGSITKALGDYSHAEGDNTQAIGNYSHAEGQETIASGSYSHAEGYGTIALASHQHVQGQWNITTSVPAAFIVGNGTDNNNRSNLIYAAGTQVEITGSLVVSDSITGSLQGTSSYANEALTASYALNSTSAASASYVLNAVSSSFATTASFVNTLDQNLTLIGNQTITGSLTVTNNLIVLGSSSLQYMSQSTLNIGTNLITVNTFNPSVRFGGLAVIDSGSSPQVSGSFLYDSVHDEFIFVHRGDGTNVTSSHFLVGPQTYNDLGNETYIAANTILKSQGNEHVVASTITDNGSLVAINNNTSVTGAFTVLSGSAVELQVTGTGVKLGNVLTDFHMVTGSFNVNGSSSFNGNVTISGSSSPGLLVRGAAASTIATFQGSDGAYRAFFGNTQHVINVTNGGTLSVRPNEGTTNNPGLDFVASTFGGLSYIEFAGLRYRIGHTGPNNANAGLLFQGRSALTSLNTPRFSFDVNSTSITTTSGTSTGISYIDTFAAGAGSALYRPLSIAYTINNSGAQTGTTTGIFLNATETALNSMTHNLMDLQTGGISRFRITNTGATRIAVTSNVATAGSTLTVIGSGSAQPIFTVQGSQGELFSVTDSLSGSLFSVNDISGLPILEVFSDNTILMGDYQDPMLLTTKKITQTVSGPFAVYSIPTASYDGAFIDYTIKSGSNARAGTIMSTWANSLIEFTEVDTMDIGSTTAVNLSMVLSGANAILTGSSSTGAWTIRTIIRTI